MRGRAQDTEEGSDAEGMSCWMLSIVHGSAQNTEAGFDAESVGAWLRVNRSVLELDAIFQDFLPQPEAAEGAAHACSLSVVSQSFLSLRLSPESIAASQIGRTGSGPSLSSALTVPLCGRMTLLVPPCSLTHAWKECTHQLVLRWGTRHQISPGLAERNVMIPPLLLLFLTT